MSDTQLQDNLYWKLLQVSLRAKHGLVKLSGDYDLTVMQTFTLCLMEPGKGVPMSAVSGWLGCDASNVTGIADRLLAGGYIVRQEHPTDRRIKNVQLTEKGAKTRTELLQRTAATGLPGASCLTHEETETLKNLLGKTLAGCSQENAADKISK